MRLNEYTGNIRRDREQSPSRGASSVVLRRSNPEAGNYQAPYNSMLPYNAVSCAFTKLENKLKGGNEDYKNMVRTALNASDFKDEDVSYYFQAVLDKIIAPTVHGDLRLSAEHKQTFMSVMLEKDRDTTIDPLKAGLAQHNVSELSMDNTTHGAYCEELFKEIKKALIYSRDS